MRHIHGLLALLLTLGCGAPALRSPTLSDVGIYTSPGRTFRTNLHWIEGPTGVVLLDTGFLPSDALAAKRTAEEATGKPVELAIVLHANPDKFNGTAALQAEGVRVVTSEAVAELIPDVHAMRYRAFASRYPGEYPERAPIPEALGARRTTIVAGGTEIRLHALGPGCSEAHLVVEWHGHVFVGDLVAHRTHAWMELGQLDAWHDRLDEIAALNPAWVHPGRGPSGGPSLLDEQHHYLSVVERHVRASAPDVPLSDAARAPLRRAIEEAFPNYAFPVFLDIGLPAVARELEGRRASTRQ